MKTSWLVIATLGAALAAPLPASAQAAKEKETPKTASKAAPKPAPIARVNGVPIPKARQDLMVLQQQARGTADGEQTRALVREELINREVLAQAATKRGLDKNPDIQAQMEMARQAVLVRALFEDEVKKNPISDAQLQQQYEQFKASMGTNEYKVRHILVDKEDDAKAIIAELNKGGDFAKLAKDKSKDPGSKDNGGDLDWGPSARYVKPFADAVTSMQKGQTTPAPVKTDFGYHVIRLDDVRPLTVPPFTELKEQFRQRAQQQQVQKMVMDLRNRAKIEER
jgi:peptidyl-prolyl cis-trans isomerase C